MLYIGILLCKGARERDSIMKKIKKSVLFIFSFLAFICLSNAHAGLNDLCSDKSFGLKVGSMGKNLGLGIESRCTSPSYMFWEFDIDYSLSEKIGTKRSHTLVPAFGVGYDFVDVAGVEDLHPFLNLQALASLGFFNKNVDAGPGFRFGLGADYFLTDGISAGLEYQYSRVFFIADSTPNVGYSSFFARINFVY